MTGRHGRRSRTGGHIHEERLLTTVVEFIADGLRVAEPALVLATAGEYRLIRQQLDAAFSEVADLERTGQLTFVDADEMLDTIVVDGTLHVDLFRHRAGAVIEAVLRAQPAHLVRIYTNMVAVLRRRGQTDVALQLEAVFYSLAETHAFSLMCAYAMGQFSKQLPASQYPHDHLSPAPPITTREQDVLQRAVLGHSNKDIANGLNISVRTVEAHKANAMRKLGLPDRADLVRFALAQGWLGDR